jgi:hypothetical protein
MAGTKPGHDGFGIGMRPTSAAHAAVLGSLALAFATPAHAQTTDCRAGQKPQQVAELLFGRNIGGRVGVSQAQWARFLDREITPRFPEGLTVIDAKGQWRDPARGTIVHEPSKRVEILLPGRADDQDRLDAIALAYKSRFHQQSVAVIVRSACVSV